MKKFFIGFLLAFTIFLVPRSVSASVDISFPSEWVSSSVNADQYRNYLSALSSNPSFRAFDSGIVTFSNISNNSITVHIMTPENTFQKYNQWTGQYFTWVMGYCSYFICNPSVLSSYSFTKYYQPEPVSSGIIDGNSIGKLSNGSYDAPDFVYISGTSNIYQGAPFFGSYSYPVALFSFDNSFSPENNGYTLTGWLVGSDTSMQAFYDWLISTGKWSSLPDYIGTAKLKSFIDFYHNYGGSGTSFLNFIPQWFSYWNIINQTSDNINSLKNAIDSLYREFLNQYKVDIARSDSSQLAHHRNAIHTHTDDSDLSLVTDDQNDDVYTLLLRDILRGIISLGNQLFENTSAIINKLDSLNFTVAVNNNGGVPSGTDLNPVLNKIDDIIDKLEADTVSVEIDQTTQDDTDEFFDDWNLEFSTALNNKFPVAFQLSTLFTEFWEKCGVDADGDGETFQYYNPGVLSASVTRSGSAGASESDIVTDFLGKFDDSDPSFLDDASFNGVPDLSVTVGGQSVSILDFRVYAKYRDKIHFIVSFVIWTLYLLHLYKSLPSIIGQVADVAVKSSDL